MKNVGDGTCNILANRLRELHKVVRWRVIIVE